MARDKVSGQDRGPKGGLFTRLNSPKNTTKINSGATLKKSGRTLAKWHETILTKLNKYSGFDVDFSDDHIVVTCQNPERFDVSIHTTGEKFRVGFDGWHEHFDAEEDALNCFAFRLSQECRLKVVIRGKMECNWTAQAWQDDTWVDDTTTGLIFIPLWRPKHIEYRHNLINNKNG